MRQRTRNPTPNATHDQHYRRHGHSRFAKEAHLESPFRKGGDARRVRWGISLLCRPPLEKGVAALRGWGIFFAASSLVTVLGHAKCGHAARRGCCHCNFCLHTFTRYAPMGRLSLKYAPGTTGGACGRSLLLETPRGIRMVHMSRYRDSTAIFAGGGPQCNLSPNLVDPHQQLASGATRRVRPAQ